MGYAERAAPGQGLAEPVHRFNIPPGSFDLVIAAFEGLPPTHAQLIGGALVIGAVSFASWPARSTAQA